MKIGFPADNNHLDARVADRMSSADWLMVVDTDTMSFETMPAPPSSGGAGAGVMAVTFLMEMGATVIMTGFMSPGITQSLESSGITVIINISGPVRQAVEHYHTHGETDRLATESMTASHALKKTLKQFSTMVPVLTGVIMIMGLVQVFLSRELVLAVFSKHAIMDTVTGTIMGSIFAGNPVNSYVIARALMELGADWSGACALMMAWVTIGLVQLPAEVHAMGLRFAVVRNTAAFIMTILFSILTVFLAGV